MWLGAGLGTQQARGQRAAGAWATRRRARGTQASAGRRCRQTAGARGAGGKQVWCGRGLGSRAGQGYALGALGLFSTRFDSVLFLSQFLDIVRESSS